MSYNLYDASVVVAKDALSSLSNILKQAQEHPNSASFPEARLIDDMLPLSFQVFMVTDLASKIVARTSGAEPTKFERNMTTFDDFHKRIAEAMAIVEKADAATVNAKAEEIVPLGLGPGKTVQIASKDYINGYAMPNIFFHLTTAYAILRKEGVPLGKQVYQRPFLGRYLPADF